MAARRSKTPRVVRAGDTVTYHDADGAIEVTVVGFGPGWADLVKDDGTPLLGVREGDDDGQWSR